MRDKDSLWEKKEKYPDDCPENGIYAVLLTSSGKNGGACVAAFDLRTKKFVRFVSNASTGAEIPFEEIRGLSIFDIVKVEAPQRCPLGPQTENVLVEAFGLRRVGRYSGTIEEIRKEIQYPDDRSLAFWESNRIKSIYGYRHSLEIITVEDLVLRKTRKRNGDLTTRADFSYRGKLHQDYRVTDFTYDLRERKENEISIPCADIILSIPKEDYKRDGFSLGYFKFVAAIFPIECAKVERDQVQIRRSFDDSIIKQGMTRNPGGNAYEHWTEREDKQLIEEFETGMSMRSMAEVHARSLNAIRSRLKKLGKIQ